MLGGSESRLRRGFGLGPKRSHGACAPPRAAGPQRAEEDAPSYSSSLSTAINASVGSCTLPRLRIFFLPVPQSALCGAGKKKMRNLGSVQLPTEAFMAVLKLDE